MCVDLTSKHESNNASTLLDIHIIVQYQTSSFGTAH